MPPETSPAPSPAAATTSADPDLGPAPALDGEVEPLAVELRISLLRTARKLRAMKSNDELSDGQFSVLAHLVVNGPRTPGELAEAEHVRPPSMTRTIAVLADAGLVDRTDHPVDGRQVLISASDAGLRTVEETRRRRAAWLSLRLAELTPAQRAVLAEASSILRTVISA
ncbi:MarR family winged helix-turn-helix transcriptional regulator [Kineococcus rubinsiae]|uniref:MarR family winged helix-turn-helix transcriptional regulator n=1 Tax=Kineococcus rubinsiae TaxID=2609562 RepID=UPI0027E5962E|nr:MarR family transcriptional regulator [Kineococcus rubinsiae]